MTYCESIGLKIGDKIRVLGENRTFEKGSIIEIVRDDGDISPLFSDGTDKKHFTLKATCGGEGEQWERVDDDGSGDPSEENSLNSLIDRLKEAVEAQREAEFLVDSLVEEFEEKFESETGLKCSVDTIFSGL